MRDIRNASPLEMSMLSQVRTHCSYSKVMLDVLLNRTSAMNSELSYATQCLHAEKCDEYSLNKALGIISKVLYLIRMDEVDAKYTRRFYTYDAVQRFHELIARSRQNLAITMEECMRLCDFAALPPELQDLFLKQNLLELAIQNNSDIDNAQKAKDAAFSIATAYFVRPAFIEYTELDGQKIPSDIDLRNFINTLSELHTTKDPYQFFVLIQEFLCGTANLLNRLILLGYKEYAGELNQLMVNNIMRVFIVFRYHLLVPYNRIIPQQLALANKMRVTDNNIRLILQMPVLYTNQYSSYSEIIEDPETNESKAMFAGTNKSPQNPKKPVTTADLILLQSIEDKIDEFYQDFTNQAEFSQMQIRQPKIIKKKSTGHNKNKYPYKSFQALINNLLRFI